MSRSDDLDPLILLDQIKRLTTSSSNVEINDSTRKQLRDAARELSFSLESPGDTIYRIAFMPLQSAMTRIGVEVNLFDILVESEVPLGSLILAEKTGIDPVLMRRFLRYYASFCMIAEEEGDLFSATNVTRALATPGRKAGIKWNFDCVSGTYMQLPKFLRETNYQNVSDSAHCPWQLAHKTDQNPFSWLMDHPDHFADFNMWMTYQHEGLPIWLDSFPLDELFHGVEADRPMFVDIGGGIGHQCLAFREKFAYGTVFLQDVPVVVEQAKSLKGIEVMAYDFFAHPQPVKGARAYYMRNVLHDWPNDKCALILQNTMSAMTADSRILIDEMVVPEKGAHWRATQYDLNMMTCLASLERSLKQWYDLLESVGLEILKVHTYTDELQQSVIVAALRRE